MAPNVKWAIVGTGWMANKFAEDFKQVSDGILYAVQSRSLAQANSFAASYQIPHTYNSLEALVNDAQVDVIYITSPHAYHYEQALFCLQHGKAVVCEKPVTINAKQLQHLLRVAREQQVFFMEAMWMYFLPTLVKVREWLLADAIGEVQFVKAEMGFKNTFNPTHRLYNPVDGGGALLDIGIYPVAFALYVLGGQYQTLHATASFNALHTDNQTAVQLQYASGAMAQLSCSFNTKMCNGAFIFGSKGSIHVPDFFMSHEAFLYSDQGNDYIKDERITTGYNFEADAVNQALLAKQTECTIMPWQASVACMQLLDAIRAQIGLKYPME